MSITKKIIKSFTIILTLCFLINTNTAFCSGMKSFVDPYDERQIPIPNVDMNTLRWYEATFGIYKEAYNLNRGLKYLSAYNIYKEYNEGKLSKSSIEVLQNTLTRNLAMQWNVVDYETAMLVLIDLVNSGLVNKSAWDFSRAMSNVETYYEAGYIEFDVAMKLSYLISGYIRETFNSWDEFNNSYLLGYYKWSNSTDREEIYKGMISNSVSNIFATLPWDMPLVEYK